MPARNTKHFEAQPWNATPDLASYAWRAAKPRATVLLQHGYAEYAGRYVDHYARLIPSLNREGFNVFAFDMTGHGHSPGDRGVTDIGAMVAAHIGARRVMMGEVRPLFLFGHSLGGLVTAASLARDPAGVAGVVLSGPALPTAWPLSRLLARGIAKIWPGLGVASLGPPSGISRRPEEVEAYVRDPLVFKRKIPALLGATAVAEVSALFGRLERWTTPTLIIHGSADSYAPPKPAKRLFARLAATDKTLHLIEGGRHELLNDEGGEEMLALVLDWLDVRAGGSSRGSKRINEARDVPLANATVATR